MASTPFLMGFLFGFVPAMGLLYIILQRYQRFFDEKRVFRTFLVGLVAGAVAQMIEVGLAPPLQNVAGVSITGRTIGQLAMYAVLLSVLESLVMAAVLNWKTFRARRDTPYYGVALGLGFGAMQVVFLMASAIFVFEQTTAAIQWEDLAPILALGVYFLGGILVAGALGGWIGRGTSVGPLVPNVFRAIVARTLYVLLLYVILVAPAAWVGYVFAVVGVASGILIVVRATIPLLDRVVPPEILREMEVHNRRIARKALREDEPPT